MKKINHFFVVFFEAWKTQGGRKTLRWMVWIVLRKLRILLPAEIKVSIIMSVHNTNPQVLATTIKSVMRQTYYNWELCICDNGSTQKETLDVLNQCRNTDTRIKVVRSDSHLNIEDAMKLTAEFTTGDFVGFLEEADALQDNGIQRVIKIVEENPKEFFHCCFGDHKFYRKTSYLSGNFDPLNETLSFESLGGKVS